LLSFITILIFTTNSQAQSKSNVTITNKEKNLVELFKRADLNDVQQIKSRMVITSYEAQIAAVLDNTKQSFEEKKNKIKLLNEEQDKELKEIMGAAQFKAFETARQAQKLKNID
jgi:hypothetical protein